MIAMKSKTDFHNPRIVKEDGTHTVAPGEAFSTDWLHAKELVALGHAEAVDPDQLEREPSDAVAPHYGVSVGDHAAINARRKGGANGTGTATRTAAAAAALERVQKARAALDDAERGAKDKPSAAAKAKLDAAQAEYDEAETEAKAFT